MTDETARVSTKPAGYAALGSHIAELRAQGICPTCQDIHNGDVFVDQVIVIEDDLMRIVLDQFPRAYGQTIVVWKAHHEDFTSLTPEETAALFTRCTEVANAIKQGLGAEKVYLVTMCDGFPNHLHVQLLPRFAGEPIGSKRFVGPRSPLDDGESIAHRIRAAMHHP